jgi:hypothetical protein
MRCGIDQGATYQKLKVHLGLHVGFGGLMTDN